MKNLFILFAIFFSQLVCSSQVKVTTTSDSVGVDFLFVKIPLATLQPGLNNTSLYTLQGGIDIFFNKKWFVSAGLSYSLLDRFYPISEDGNEFLSDNLVSSVNKSTAANYGEVRSTYFFNDYTTKMPLKVKLGNRGEEVNLYTEVEGSVRKMQGIRLGVRKGITWYHLNAGSLNSGEDEREISSSDQSTMLDYWQLRAGFEWTSITNLRVQAEGFGKRHNAKIQTYYADLLFQPSMKFDDVYYYSIDNASELVLYSRHAVEGNNDEIPLGIEVGSRVIPLAGKIGYHYALGYSPGLKGSVRLYAEGGFNFYFGKVRNKY